MEATFYCKSLLLGRFDNGTHTDAQRTFAGPARTYTSAHVAAVVPCHRFYATVSFKVHVLYGMQVLCQGKLVLCTCIHSNLCLAAQPAGLQRQPRLARRGCRKQTLWRRCATEDTSKGTDVVDVQKIGTIPFSRDEETLVDVMAFAGPAPEVMQQPVMAFPSLSFLFSRN